jgi:hypothetical protein
MGFCLHLVAHLGPRLDNGCIHQIADDAVDVAPDIADLGELRRLDLQEGRLGQLRQTTADLGLAHPCRPDHQDVLRIDLVAQIVAQLLAPPAVAHGDGDGALRVLLADDVAVKLRDDFARGKRGHAVSA